MSALGRYVTILMLALGPCVGLAAGEDGPWFISPGIRMSYSIGERSGFAMGFEVSLFTMVHWQNGVDFGAAGIILDVDAIGPRRRLHIGVEASYAWVGFSLGPTFVTDSTRRSVGFTATIYSWYWVYPFYSFTWAGSAGTMHDVGAYLKLPIPLGGRDAFKQ
jgi:hypothetical protein